ncbi:MAG: NAD(P)-dependent oxidoreductase [bacterium]|nr:NAD(P)-dependent oxidoreductase [bacterium]
MQFKKALLIGIAEANLGKEYWVRIDALAEKKVFLPKDSADIRKELADADCLLVGFGVPVTKEDINTAPDLKYIGVLATAFGKIDVEHAKEKGIPVCNLAGYSTESVAEFTIAAVLEAIRGLAEGRKRGEVGEYDESGIKAWEIKGKVFGVLGLGSIGNRVAELAQGFGADVRYWSRNRKDDAEAKGIKYQELDELLKEADFLSINLAQASETENILNKERIDSLKENVVVINTCPMELVDLDALAARLLKGDITFILDHSDEMEEEDLKKIASKNCIIYPPMAYITKEAALNRQEMFASNLEAFSNGSPANVVNK